MSTAHAATLPSASLLKQQWDTYRQQNKRAFMYDAAIEFGVSEAQLLAT